MVSDFRPIPCRERCSLELRVRSKPATCTFREDVQRTSKEFLESSSDSLPDPCHASIPIQLLISDTLCGWSLTGSLLEAAVGQSIQRKKYLLCSPYQNCENNSNPDGNVDNNRGSRKKRKTQTNEFVESSSYPRRIGKQNLSISPFSWKACVDEGTDCYRPDNGDYLQWKTSVRSQLSDGIEKQSGGKSRDGSSPGDAASKPDAESQPLQEHVVEEKEGVEEQEGAGKVESDHVTHFFGFGSSKDSRLEQGDVLVARSIIREEDTVKNGRCLVVGQLLKAGSLRRGGLPEERPSLPPILSQGRFSHPSQSSERRRLELGMLSVEGVQLPEARRRCEEDVEEEDGGKQMEDWNREEQEEEEVEEKEEEEKVVEKEDGVEVEEKEEVEVESEEEVEESEAGEKPVSESEVYDVFDSNDSFKQNSGIDFERNVRYGKMEAGNERRSNEKEEEEASTQLDIDFNQSPEVGQDEDEDTNSSLSLKVDEARQNPRRIMVTDRGLRCRNPDSDFEDRKGESLTGVLTISGICPRIGSDGSLPSSSDTASGCSPSESNNAPHLDAIHSRVTIEDGSTIHEGSEEKGEVERLCLDFRRNPNGGDLPSSQPAGLPRLRVFKGTKPHRSRTPPPGPSRNRVEIAGAKVIGVTFGGQNGHVTPAKRDVAADMTSSEEVVETSSSCAVKKCDVIKYLTQSNCGRGYSSGFHPQPIGLHHRSRKKAEGTECCSGDVSLISSNANVEVKLPSITVTRVQRL